MWSLPNRPSISRLGAARPRARRGCSWQAVPPLVIVAVLMLVLRVPGLRGQCRPDSRKEAFVSSRLGRSG
eukprot:349096-Pyramimonas_sp.AAC.1